MNYHILYQVNFKQIYKVLLFILLDGVQRPEMNIPQIPGNIPPRALVNLPPGIILCVQRLISTIYRELRIVTNRIINQRRNANNPNNIEIPQVNNNNNNQ